MSVQSNPIHPADMGIHWIKRGMHDRMLQLMDAFAGEIPDEPGARDEWHLTESVRAKRPEIQDGILDKTMINTVRILSKDYVGIVLADGFKAPPRPRLNTDPSLSFMAGQRLYGHVEAACGTPLHEVYMASQESKARLKGLRGDQLEGARAAAMRSPEELHAFGADLVDKALGVAYHDIPGVPSDLAYAAYDFEFASTQGSLSEADHRSSFFSGPSREWFSFADVVGRIFADENPDELYVLTGLYALGRYERLSGVPVDWDKVEGSRMNDRHGDVADRLRTGRMNAVIVDIGKVIGRAEMSLVVADDGGVYVAPSVERPPAMSSFVKGTPFAKELYDEERYEQSGHRWYINTLTEQDLTVLQAPAAEAVSPGVA